MIQQTAAELKHYGITMEFEKSSDFFFCFDIRKEKVKKLKASIAI